MSKQPGKGKAPPYHPPIPQGNFIALAILYVLRLDRRSDDVSFHISSLEVLCVCVRRFKALNKNNTSKFINNIYTFNVLLFVVVVLR